MIPIGPSTNAQLSFPLVYYTPISIMACSLSTLALSPAVSFDTYTGGSPYYSSLFRYPMNPQGPSISSRRGRRPFSTPGPQHIVNQSHNAIYLPQQGGPTRSQTSPASPSSGPNQYRDHAWSPQPSSQHVFPVRHHSYASYSEAAAHNQSPPQQHHSKSHSGNYSGEFRSHRRDSLQSLTQSYFPPISFQKQGRSSSPTATHTYSSSTSSSSPPSSPVPFSDILTPVHLLYAGLPRTESGLIPIPACHVFNRGEIVMTRTTRRLMKTSSTGRLTARHPCLILEATESHVRVLQMTSHVDLTVDQVRVVGAQLEHWLAREDPIHQDYFGRPGLRTSPPSDRAGYIWVGDEGEWVPIEQIKYLTGTRVEEHEIRRLEALTIEHGKTFASLLVPLLTNM